MTLTDSDRESLHTAFQYGEPVAADVLARYTGLDLVQLERAGIVRKIGRWDNAIYKGAEWSRQVEK